MIEIHTWCSMLMSEGALAGAGLYDGLEWISQRVKNDGANSTQPAESA